MQDGSETANTNAQHPASPDLELLAPAGDWSALEAALEAGATAVYFGLRALNARRQARNFGQEEFGRAVEFVHARGARAYVTLNIDLTERELGLAARTLCWARDCGADAVLIRDPALLALREGFPEIEFHFSTQSCITSSSDVEAAAALGIDRVVLAREMSLPEIRAASQIAGVQTEVFAQGALCFSVSGRCQLSSWVGGRSGNRGTCTSPCRVPWTAEGRQADTPFSMRDLLTAHRLTDLRQAGVVALKIEGRMKNAAWVRSAVELYRRALDGEDPTELIDAAHGLGAYTGRVMTCGYLDGRRDELTGSAGRAAGPAEYSAQEPDRPTGRAGNGDAATFDMDIEISSRGIECRCTCGTRSEQWTLPKTVVRRKHKAVPVGAFLTWLQQQQIRDCGAGQLTTNEPDYLLVPRAANSIVDRIGAVLTRAHKKTDQLVGIGLPQPVKDILEKTAPSPANHAALGSTPNHVRLDASAVGQFVRHYRPHAMIVEGMAAGSVAKLRRAARKIPIVAALPTVFFEEDIPRLTALLAECKQAGLPVEVNSWGGWALARSVGVRMDGGPGLAVLNSLAARKLSQLGLRSVTLSVEADRRKLEELTAHCPVPCSLIVFGRPALLTSRAQLPEEEFRDRVLVDRREVRVKGRKQRGLWVFRPVEPFDLRDVRNDRIRVAHLVVDLVGSDDPAAEFRGSLATDRKPFRFNYHRTLV
jgi:putative protease